ncbi:deubiquitinase OTUD6B isoform X2 [Echinops telfairi]|uniref:Deubiquitinase OTUD6B isoform X2 n=1 Tax=Echinops telfairi TaxID=9371 RepID=A0AC55CVL6_ECHTE|nr:deubiquitinase OTUD6B isoform X2 [Echinops telfairi]
MEAVLTEELDDEEQLMRRHRKEKKELQAKIQSMKNAVPKNDKKRRKQLVEDVAKLEAEMEQKHREELEQLKLTSKENKIDSVAVNISNLVLETQQPRISKAQKRREKKAALEKEREERIAEAEIENLSGARQVESQKLAQMLAARQLEIKQIPSDGHCLYRAIEDQLKEQGGTVTVAALRRQTAEYMQSHVEDFLPFLTNPNTGDIYTLEDFGKYCDDVVNTAAWGGQLEIYETCIWLRRTLQFCYTVDEHSYRELQLVYNMLHSCALVQCAHLSLHPECCRELHVTEKHSNL